MHATLRGQCIAEIRLPARLGSFSSLFLRRLAAGRPTRLHQLKDRPLAVQLFVLSLADSNLRAPARPRRKSESRSIWVSPNKFTGTLLCLGEVRRRRCGISGRLSKPWVGWTCERTKRSSARGLITRKFLKTTVIRKMQRYHLVWKRLCERGTRHFVASFYTGWPKMNEGVLIRLFGIHTPERSVLRYMFRNAMVSPKRMEACCAIVS